MKKPTTKQSKQEKRIHEVLTRAVSRKVKHVQNTHQQDRRTNKTTSILGFTRDTVSPQDIEPQTSILAGQQVSKFQIVDPLAEKSVDAFTGLPQSQFAILSRQGTSQAFQPAKSISETLTPVVSALSNLTLAAMHPNANPCDEYLSSINSHYLSIQDQFIATSSQEKRGWIIDFICWMARQIRLDMDSVFLAVNIYDRVYDATSLIGTGNRLRSMAALFVAAKMEGHSFRAQQMTVFDNHGKITREDILRIEGLILAEIGFNLSFISSRRFVNIWCEQWNLNKDIRENAQKLCLKAMGINELRGVRPNVIATICISLAKPGLRNDLVGEMEMEQFQNTLTMCRPLLTA